MPAAVKIQNLYKEYRLGVIGSGTLYRDLQSLYAKIRGIEDPNSLIINSSSDHNKKEKILALKDINLEIENGSSLGVIGSNGAGKSTLLKILSKITSPSRGEIKFNGRIASLLEVGTGFHPELTGRENIFLNGSINGMSIKEVKKKLDEIVDFAGVENFIDTPVKRYSSGMHVRLGFAVAAHLDCEILVVDEVLAVGDASFQKKAIGKMQDVRNQQEKTIIFVSHNMDSVQKLCKNSILIEQGSIIKHGSTENVINKYINKDSNENSIDSGKKTFEGSKYSSNVVKLNSISFKNNENIINSNFDVTENINIEVEYEVLKSNFQISTIVDIHTPLGVWVCTLHDEYIRGKWGNQDSKEIGKYKTLITIPANLMSDGNYLINLLIYSPPAAANLGKHIEIPDIIRFKVTDRFEINSSRGSYPYALNSGKASPAFRPLVKSKTLKIK